MNKHCISALILLSCVGPRALASPFENAALADAGVRQLLLDVGHKCGVDATQSDGDWIMGVLNYGFNAEAKDTAILAFHHHDNEAYQSAINRFICP